MIVSRDQTLHQFSDLVVVASTRSHGERVYYVYAYKPCPSVCTGHHVANPTLGYKTCPMLVATYEPKRVHFSRVRCAVATLLTKPLFFYCNTISEL